MTQLNPSHSTTEMLEPGSSQILPHSNKSALNQTDGVALATLEAHLDDSLTQASALAEDVPNFATLENLPITTKAELAEIQQKLSGIETDLMAASNFVDQATSEQPIVSAELSHGQATTLADTANRDLVTLQHQFDSLVATSGEQVPDSTGLASESLHKVLDSLNQQSALASNQGTLIANANGTVYAQNNVSSGPNGTQKFQIQDSGLNLDVVDSHTTVSDGSANYSVRVVTITRQDSPGDAPQISAESLGPELGAAASWLLDNGVLNGLPPKTVQWVQNEATGETAIQFWRGDDTRGELDGLAIQGPAGWQTVPREVLNYVPQDAVLDVVDPQGTNFERRLNNDNQYFWQASYDNVNDQRVTLSFTPDNRLALVQTEVAPSQFIYEHKDAFADLNVTTNNIDSFSGGRVEYRGDSAVAISANGDVRMNYRSIGDNQFELVNTVEMVYQNGEPTSYRVLSDADSGAKTLTRLLSNDGSLSDLAPVTTNADGSLSFEISSLTDELADGSLRIPSGETIRAVPDHQEPDPSLPVYPGQQTGNQGSNENGVNTQWTAPSSYAYTNKTTVEEKAGYADGEGTFRNYTIEVNGQRFQYELLQYKNNEGVFADRSGVEYYANVRTEPDGTEIQVVGNIQTQSAVSAGVLSTQLPDGAFFVPALGNRANEYMAQLAEQGLEPLAVLGTGFIDSGNENAGIGYQYFNPARLSNPDAPASTGTVYADAFYDKISAGYMVDREGNMSLLDYSGKSNAEIRQELATLQENPNVVAINIFSHEAAQSPEDLVGVLEATTEQTSVGKARSYMVFDAEGQFVGHSVSPAMSLLDSVTLAKQTFGDDAAFVLNMDGDFYAQNWYADGRDGSSDLARRYENAMILVRPTADGGPAPYQAEDAETQQAEDERYRNAENDDLKDAFDALREWLF